MRKLLMKKQPTKADWMLSTSIALAVEYHGSTFDKGGMPYILHPIAVMEKVRSKYEKIVAILHDAIEDTKLSLDFLERYGFDEDIIQALDAITREDNETYFQYIRRVKLNKLATTVKLADLEHNLSPERMSVLPDKEREGLTKRYYKATEMLSEKDSC